MDYITIFREGDKAVFMNIPHKYIGKKVKFTFACKDYIPLDTIVTLTKTVSLKIKRDPEVYGNIMKKLWNWKTESGVGNTQVEINGQLTESDEEGLVCIKIPLSEQNEYYIINIPLWDKTDTVFMPCNEGQVIIVNKD